MPWAHLPVSQQAPSFPSFVFASQANLYTILLLKKNPSFSGQALTSLSDYEAVGRA